MAEASTERNWDYLLLVITLSLTLMGLVMLIVIVVNNAILIMDQFNVQVREGGVFRGDLCQEEVIHPEVRQSLDHLGLIRKLGVGGEHLRGSLHG